MHHRSGVAAGADAADAVATTNGSTAATGADSPDVGANHGASTTIAAASICSVDRTPPTTDADAANAAAGTAVLTGSITADRGKLRGT